MPLSISELNKYYKLIESSPFADDRQKAIKNTTLILLNTLRYNETKDKGYMQLNIQLEREIPSPSVPSAPPPKQVMAGVAGEEQKSTSQGPCPTEFKLHTAGDISVNVPKPHEIFGLDIHREIIIKNIVPILKYPKLAQMRGIDFSNFLFYGPGGTGKTTIMLSIAVERGIPFIEVSSSNIRQPVEGGTSACLAKLREKSHVLVGGESRVMLIMDEFDNLVGGDQNLDKLLIADFKNQFQPNAKNKPLIVAATNNPWEIKDTAILDRFPNKLFIGLPNLETRRKMLENLISKLISCKMMEKRTLFGEKGIITPSKQKFLLEALGGLSGRAIKDYFGKVVEMGPLQLSNANSLVFIKRQGSDFYDPVLRTESYNKDYVELSKLSSLDKLDKICFPYPSEEDFFKALKLVTPSVSAKSLELYKKYDEEFANPINTALIRETENEFKIGEAARKKL